MSTFCSSSPQNIDFPLPCPLEVFEMLVVPEQTYPLICVAVSKGTELNQVVKFGTVNPNSTSSWFTEAGENSLSSWFVLKSCRCSYVKHGRYNNNLFLVFHYKDMPQTCVIHVTQLERDTILVCLDSE